LGWDSPDASAQASLMLASHSPESYEAAAHASLAYTLDDLADIQIPTLILYPMDSEGAARRTRRIASEISGAQVLAVPGDHPVPYPNAAGLSLILDFIKEPGAAESAGKLALNPGVFRTILFTDLEAHTAMLQRLGDAKGREVLREHERISREALRAHGGAEVKAMGDGFMASFPSAQRAVECAIALQRAFATGDFAGERLRIRVGINAGEPIADEDDLFGASVILASRTKEKAGGGEILVTDVVRQLVAGKGFAFTDRGEMEMKGFEEPVRLFEVEVALTPSRDNVIRP
jgi:class 3 adenylate cyclase